MARSRSRACRPHGAHATGHCFVARERPLQGGASGAFVFSSVDGAVVVKTLDAAEAELLCELAPAFAAHFDAHPTSLINRFLGCFRMKLYSQTIHFVVVSSVFAAATRAEVAAPAALLRRLDA